MAENELQQKLQESLVNTYLSNLTFLSEYDKSLYEKIDSLSFAIENGQYLEKYRLEFVEENGDFDIYDLKNDKYLYNRNPKKINNKMKDNISLDNKNTIKTLEKAIYNISFKRFDNNRVVEMKESLQDVDESIQLVRNNILEYINVFEKEEHSTKLKKVDKFIFFGTILGRHINPIAEKVDASSYFVCERNLELFRLSLFVNDYKNLAKKQGVIFSIMDEEEDLQRKIEEFIGINNPFSNYLIKLSSTGMNIQEYVDAFLTYIVINKPTSFDYNRIQYTLMRNISRKIGNYNILEFKKEKVYDIFNESPVLFVAAGPSFHEKLEWIKSNQDKFYIVTVGAAYKTLIENGIRVDMIITLDSSYRSLGEKQFSQENVDLINDNTIILASTMTDERLLNRFSNQKLFLYEIMFSYFGNEAPMDAYSVGEKSVYILLNMNVKNLYLIGLDLALNQSTGDTHGSTSDSNKSNYDIEKLDLSDRSTFGLQTGIIKVKGNFNEKVLTTSLFNASIKSLNRILIEKKNNDNTIYNLSTHGAFFINTIPLKTEDTNCNSFNSLSINKDDLYNLLLHNSETNIFVLGDIQKIENEISYIKVTIFSEFNDCRKKEFEDYRSFHLGIRKLIYLLALKNENTTLLSAVFKNYFDISLNYLEYMFNDRKLKKEKKKVQKIKEIFFSQCEVLLNDYLRYLEGIKKPKS
ncbi:6-hydroxymethylpterin diphosphokinase MptE-like protein [Arcobacter peruensis]|uniref:6-hydroxymethylpterin diphosphokinase MptE-like protein n=1 Tax=Arcobacter peruensis TaxID=2320140 RepID=UPI000F073317|nr:6-hydroxymethylpterin diphosphokinase MptE-like protein [Arcobacter peruensis]